MEMVGESRGRLGVPVLDVLLKADGEETSPMTMQPQCCSLMPEKVGHRHGVGLAIKSVQVQEIVCSRCISIALPHLRGEKKAEEFWFKVT